MEKVIQYAKENKIDIDDKKIELLNKYLVFLKEWNNKFNLTSIKTDEEIILKHFVDSMTIIPHIKDGQKIIDIGSGAGFPGMIIKIFLPKTEIHLLESTKKKAVFLEELSKELGFKDVVILNGRAEEFGHDKKFREKFDIAVARAVALLPTLLEYSIPFLKTEGLFIAMKKTSTEEIEMSEGSLDKLESSIEKTININFDELKERSLLLIRKNKRTPVDLPRPNGMPSKEPL